MATLPRNRGKVGTGGERRVAVRDGPGGLLGVGFVDG